MNTAVGGVQRRVVLHAEVQVQDVEGVEQLALVLVQTLDLNVEDRVGVDLNALAILDPRGKVNLVGVLDLAQALEHVSVPASVNLDSSVSRGPTRRSR